MLHPGSAIHLGFHAENTPVHIILTHHAINGFDLADRDILYIMTPYIRQAFENVAHLRQMEKLTTDSLTGISNRGHFLELAVQELARSKRFGRPTGILMIDADHFKDINDRYGHDAGDAALQQLATTVRRELREADILDAWGEEFAVLVVEADRAKATQVGERIRAAIESTPIVQHGYCFRDNGQHWRRCKPNIDRWDRDPPDRGRSDLVRRQKSRTQSSPEYQRCTRYRGLVHLNRRVKACFLRTCSHGSNLPDQVDGFRDRKISKRITHAGSTRFPPPPH